MEKKRSSFSGSIGFVLAAAGSAIGLGNLWRFPYFAAKNGGGLFFVVYLVLLVTFGFTLLITEVSIGRKTKHSPLKAYGAIDRRWGWIGFFAVSVPFLILPYYCAIGGWVLKYCAAFLTGQAAATADSGFFGGYITSVYEPLLFMTVFLCLTSFVIYRGINEGIERISKLLMPLLLLIVVGVSLFSLTVSFDDGTGVRTGMDGLAAYIIPTLEGLTPGRFMGIVLDAMSQLFFSISIAMGIMITYGSYFDDAGNLFDSVKQIGFFDTFVAFLAGVMTTVPLYVLMGEKALTVSGPSLLFVSMPKLFEYIGTTGTVVGAAFFVMVLFAALTSSISIMEAVVSSIMEQFSVSRKKATVLESGIAFVIGAAVCLGYNVFYFELPLPNGAVGQVLDVLDYISNNIMMPIVAITTCILVGWAAKPEAVIDEATKNGETFIRREIFVLMVKYVAPLLLTLLFLQSLGVMS